MASARSEVAKALQRFCVSISPSTDRFSFRDYKRAVLLKRSSAPACGARLTKLQKIEMALRQPGGASLGDLRQLTGWQAHSVRGAISGALKKKRGLTVSVKNDPHPRRYVIEGNVAAEGAPNAARVTASRHAGRSRCAAAKLFRLASAEGTRTR